MITKTSRLLKNQMDKTIMVLKKDNKKWVEEHFLNREIIDAAHSKTRISGLITDGMKDNGPFAGVTVMLTPGNKSNHWPRRKICVRSQNQRERPKREN